MKRIRSSTLAKIVAIFLFFLSLIARAVSAVGVIFLAKNEAYLHGIRLPAFLQSKRILVL